MRVLAILNRDGGTLRNVDFEAFSALMRAAFEEAGHDFTLVACAGRELSATLEYAAADQAVDAIIAGGGDGTISSAARTVWASGKALGVIPAGTMNLFARSIGIPLEINEAVLALAKSEIVACDIATANGRPFVHQFSVGMQARVIKERDRLPHHSRLGKILAGARATLGMLARPPKFRVQLTVDGDMRDLARLNLISVSNNPYGPGHMPYADRLDGGVLGIYWASRLSPTAGMKLTADLATGSWEGNENLHRGVAQEVVLRFPHLKSNALASIDGELIRLEKEVRLKIHAGALRILKPLSRQKGAVEP